MVELVLNVKKNFKKSDKKSVVYDVTEVLEKFGKYQIIQLVLLCIPTIFASMTDVNYVFAAEDLNYRCRIPECENSTVTYEAAWWPKASIDRCSKPLLRADHGTGSACTNESFSEELGICGEWVYETNNTVVAELDLACRPWLANLIGAVHSFGMMLSMLVTGWMCDRFGRKPTFIFCVVNCWIGLLKTLATSYCVYVTIEFLEAAFTGGSYEAGMIIMLEISGKESRVLSGVICAFAVYFGEMLYAFIAMYVPYWKNLIYIIYGPPILFISYMVFIRESLRWQIINGNTEKAKTTLLFISDMNNININRQATAELDETKLKSKFNIGADEKIEDLRGIFTSKEILKRIFVVTIVRFTVDFVYYGMMINSVFLPGNKYTNFLLSTVMSFPGELISLYVMTRIGRKIPMIIGFLLSGLLCIGTGYVPETFIWAKILLFLLGKMLISACFTGSITYTMELFPTSIRGSMHGFGSFASRVGGTLAPLTPLLNPISDALPPILFGCSALLSGILLTLMPETKDLPLMDTIRHVEESVRTAKEMKKPASDSLEITVVTQSVNQVPTYGSQNDQIIMKTIL